MTLLSWVRRPWWLAVPLMLCLGCGSGQSARPTDPGQALQTLRVVLDAWKAGETPQRLESRTPAIHVADPDWSAGFSLVGYQADSAGRLVGYDMNYPVVLELKDAKGRSLKKEAVYVITTAPMFLVLRQEG